MATVLDALPEFWKFALNVFLELFIGENYAFFDTGAVVAWDGRNEIDLEEHSAF